MTVPVCLAFIGPAVQQTYRALVIIFPTTTTTTTATATATAAAILPKL